MISKTLIDKLRAFPNHHFLDTYVKSIYFCGIIPTINNMKTICKKVLMLCLILSAAIDITTAAGVSVDYNSLTTPNGVNFYIPLAGSYVVNFTLPDGDEYYGEFEVTD